VDNPTVRKRSDVVAPDSSLIHPNNNPKKRDQAVPGIGVESLKTAKKLGKKSAK